MSQGYESSGLRRRRVLRKIKIYTFLLLFLLILVGGLYAVAHAGFFKVKTYTWNGVPEADQPGLLAQLKLQTVSGGLGALLGPDNYLSWKSGLMHGEGAYADITVEKRFSGSEIVITVAARTQSIVWCGEHPLRIAGAPDIIVTDCVWVDESGVAFEPAPIPEGQLIMTVTERSTSAPRIGSAVTASDFYANIQEILKKIQSLHLLISSATYNRSLEQLEIMTASGTLLKFSVRFDPNPTALPALERYMEKPGLSAFTYIDLTVENRAFYKLRN